MDEMRCIEGGVHVQLRDEIRCMEGEVTLYRNILKDKN